MDGAWKYIDVVYQQVDAFARHGLPSGVERQDLVGWGCIGLEAAYRGFDDRRNRFEPWAALNVRWAILNEMRRWRLGSRRISKSDKTVRRAIDRRGADPAACRRAMLAEVKRLLTLPEWELLQQTYVQGRELQAIAAERGVSPSAVSMQRRAILARLRRRLKLE